MPFDSDGQKRYVLCRSSARRAKERAMLERQMTSLTEQMIKIDQALQRRAPGKIGRRIGRWQGKYPASIICVLKARRVPEGGLRYR